MNAEIVLLPDINPYPFRYELLAKLLPVLVKLLDEHPYPLVAVQNHKQLDEQSLSSLTAKPIANAPNPVAPSLLSQTQSQVSKAPLLSSFPFQTQ